MTFEIIYQNSVVTDGPDRQAVIEDAIAHFENKLAEDGEREDEFEVIVLDENDNAEKITLRVCVGGDTYDGGRSDYYFQQMGA